MNIAGRRGCMKASVALSLALWGCGEIVPASAGDAASGDDVAHVPDASPDAGMAPDVGARLDAKPDEAPAVLAAPRPIAPLSTSRVTSRRPTLRWALPPGVASATVDLCADRSCATRIGAPALVQGTSYAPADELPAGVVYWRLHPSNDTSVTSATWHFWVGKSSAPIDTSWGTTLDVNGDGYADVIAGAVDKNAPGTEAGASNAGAAYLYLGSGTGIATKPATVLNDPGTAPLGVTTTDYFGGSVASAGDVDGDGFADVIVGASGSGTVSGSAYIFLGSATGLASKPAVTLTAPDNASGEFFGETVASAGDVNGDGYTDILVGTAGVEAYLYLGSETGLGPPIAIAGAWVYAASAGDVNGDGFGDVALGSIGPDTLPDGGGTDGYVSIFLGGAAGLATTPSTTLAPSPTNAVADFFGGTVATAGDVNGDGYGDLVVGAFDYNTNSGGTVSVYLGGAAGLASTPAVTWRDPDEDASVGNGFGGSAASAGDVNGDGYADVVVGAEGSSTILGVTSIAPAAVYVYFGGPSGLATMPSLTLGDPMHDPTEAFGLHVSSAGDVNGDGYADLAVGANDSTATNFGNVYVFLGGSSGLGVTPATLENAAGYDGDFGFSVFGATN